MFEINFNNQRLILTSLCYLPLPFFSIVATNKYNRVGYNFMRMNVVHKGFSTVFRTKTIQIIQNFGFTVETRGYLW